MDRFREWIVVN